MLSQCFQSLFSGILITLVFVTMSSSQHHDLLLHNGQQIMMLGNSLTEGEDPDGYVNMTRLLLARALPEMTIYIGNAGKGGNTCVDLLARLERDVLRFQPDWVTISIGINDVNKAFTAAHPNGDDPNGVSLSDFQEKVTQIIQRIQQQGARVALFTATIIKENLSSRENMRLNQFSQALREIAANEKCLLVDMEKAFHRVLLPLQRPGIQGNLTGDGVHLNPAGSWLMAETVCRAWGVPDERIQAVKPTVETDVAQQKELLAQRIAFYQTANRGAGLPAPDRTRIVVVGSDAVARWALPDDLPAVELLNRGIAGESIRGLRMRFHQDVVALKPAAVILWPGAGADFCPESRISLADIESHLARIARLAQGSHIRLAIGSVIPTQSERNQDDLPRLNKWIAGLCQENNYLFLDFYQILVDKTGRLQPEFTDDGIRLNPAGYAALRPLLQNAVQQLSTKSGR